MPENILEQRIFLTTEIIINDYYIDKLPLKIIEYLWPLIKFLIKI